MFLNRAYQILDGLQQLVHINGRSERGEHRQRPPDELALGANSRTPPVVSLASKALLQIERAPVVDRGGGSTR